MGVAQIAARFARLLPFLTTNPAAAYAGTYRETDKNAFEDKQFDKPEPVVNYPIIQERVDAVSVLC